MLTKISHEDLPFPLEEDLFSHTTKYLSFSADGEVYAYIGEMEVGTMLSKRTYLWVEVVRAAPIGVIRRGLQEAEKYFSEFTTPILAECDTQNHKAVKFLAALKFTELSVFENRALYRRRN